MSPLPSLDDLLDSPQRRAIPVFLRAFVSALQSNTQWTQAQAGVVGRHLATIATQHRLLCSMDLSVGLDAVQSGARDALEEHLQQFAEAMPGVSGAVIRFDPRGTTMGLRYAGGAFDSLTGGYSVPTDEALYARLEKSGEHFWDDIELPSSAPTP